MSSSAAGANVQAGSLYSSIFHDDSRNYVQEMVVLLNIIMLVPILFASKFTLVL